MTNKEKNLLLKDLCARLPHKQKVCYKIRNNSEEITETLSGYLLDYFKIGKIAIVKPYLRPMSSMTEAEKTMFNSIWDGDWDKALTNQIAEAWDRNGFENQTKILEITACANAINFLISHHFDYNGLIEKGLALEAPEWMYK